jgi:hypothetical protein
MVEAYWQLIFASRRSYLSLLAYARQGLYGSAFSVYILGVEAFGEKLATAAMLLEVLRI